MQGKKKSDIVLVTWNRPKLTELTISTLVANTTSPFRLIVVDNGSEKPLVDKLRKWQDMGIIGILRLLDKNVGLEPARNLGLQMVESKYFVCTDNDILPEKPDENGDWLSKLKDLMKKYVDFGAISARTQIMIGTGNIFDGHEDEDIVEFSHPGGSLRIMKSEIVKRVGGWRDDVHSRGQEEMYICGKLREHGYRAGFATHVNCYHMFGKDKNWGYGKLPPEKHGHRPIWHPSIQNGDDINDINKYT